MSPQLQYSQTASVTAPPASDPQPCTADSPQLATVEIKTPEIKKHEKCHHNYSTAKLLV